MARKFLFGIAVVFGVVAFGPGALAANVEPEPSAFSDAADVQQGPPGGPPPALADRDNNGLSDRLQAKLAAAAPGDRFDVVVTFKRPGKGAGPVGTAASAQAAVGSFQTRREFKIIPGFAATMTAAQARALANVAGVFRVEEDFKVKAVLDDSRPDMDLGRVQDPGPDQIVDGGGAAATGLGVKICVLDTGLYAQHEMFAGRPIVWFDEVNGQPAPYDDHVDIFGTPFGHGTHTTGIAAGSPGTYLGNPISGTAWEANIIAVKVLDQNGSGPESTIIAGFDRCVESNADVISISLGGDPGGDCQDAMALAARAASGPPHNIFVAAAAGNSGPGNQTILTPACEPKVTAVGASINWSGDGLGMSLIAFSSRGPVPGPPPVGSYTKPDVVYPGALIRSAKVNTTSDYWRLSGTSMSTPGVAGLAAMARQVDPTLTAEQIQTILRDTAYDFGPPGVDDDWGAGHVNPYLFMAKIKDPLANPEPSPFQEHFLEQVAVAAVGNTFSQPFEVTAEDVAAGTPIAMVVTIVGTAFCPFGDPFICELLGEWDYDPDLDVQLHWDDGTPGTPVTASGSDITLSECVLSGEACGVFKGRGRQETIRYTPTQTGWLKLRLYSFAGSGTARVERWHRLSNAVASPPGNTAPVVDAGAGGTIDEGDPFASAGSFTDPDADSWTATVDYGDGAGPQALTLNPDKTFNLSHTYASAAGSPFTVTVTVDDGTDSGQNTAQVTVNTVTPDNTVPQVNAGAGDTIDEGGTFVSAGSFIDPDADAWTATVNYGDGSGTQTLALNPDKTFNLSHAYANNGAFTVTVMVDDGTGNGQDTALVTVNNVAPGVNAFAGGTIDEGGTYAQSGSFTDPGSDSWTATVNYGDGTGTQALALTGKTFSLSHVYTDNGLSFTVTVTVDDGLGNGQGTALVTVNNVAPGVNAGGDATINEGDNFAQSGSFTDPGSDSWLATVDYGDGAGPQALALTGKTFALSHTYASAGGSPYTVTVTVTDDDTGAGGDPVIVTVLPVAGGVGTVSGKVQDSATGGNLQGVLVTPDMGPTATTNKQGKYSINNVPEGSRTLTFSKTNYVTKAMNSVTVNAGSTTRNVNTTLVPDSGPPPDPVIVPNVVDQPEADAVSTIEAANLVASVTSQSHETIAAGTVISQDPFGGTEVAAGSTVDLVVSSGPATGGGTGTVKGTVWDSSGARVQGALVTEDTGQSSATTKKRGTFNLQNVPAGTRTLTVSKSGCEVDVLNVDVIDGATLTLPDVVLTCL
jgi:hypothetical protein